MVGGPEVGAVHLHAGAHPLDHPEEAALEEHVPEEDLPELSEGEEEIQLTPPPDRPPRAPASGIGASPRGSAGGGGAGGGGTDSRGAG